MASIKKDQFYINMLTLTREESALILAMLITFLNQDDSILDQMGDNMGVDNVRARLEALGCLIDEDWDDMYAMSKELLAMV